MRCRPVVHLALVLLLMASPAAVGVGAAGPGVEAGGDGGDLSPRSLSETPPAADGTNLTMILDVRADGDVRWTVTTYVDLETQNDTEAFEDQARAWRNRNLDLGYDAEFFRRFARMASNATGREMRIPETSVDRSADIVDDGDRGAFTLTFTWTNFARRANNHLVVNDSFRTRSGAWLTGLDAGQRLVIRPPPAFAFESHPQGARLQNGTLIWEGPATFPDSYFLEQPVVFETEDDPTPTSPTPGSPSPTPSSPGTTVPPDTDGSEGLMLGILAALLLGGGLAAYRRYGGEGRPSGFPVGGGSTDGDDGPAGGAAAESAEADAEAEPEPVPDQDAEPASDPDPEPTPEDPFAGVDPDLLSDEEQVLRLLEANGGRMKQATIVTETGWSNAKVSQLLSAMDEDEEIDKLRIGRENLISLPDVEVGEVE